MARLVCLVADTAYMTLVKFLLRLAKLEQVSPFQFSNHEIETQLCLSCFPFIRFQNVH